MEITPAMRTRDGAWQVDIVQRGKTKWYRLVHRTEQGDDVIDWLSIAGVERILAEAGIDMDSLVDAA